MSSQGDANRTRQTLRDQHPNICTIGEGESEFPAQDNSGDPLQVLDGQGIAQAIAIAQLIGRGFRFFFRLPAERDQFSLVNIGEIARGQLNDEKSDRRNDQEDEDR